MRYRVLVGAILLACASTQAAETLDVKLGLWEVTSTVKVSGTPPMPQEVLDRMTPEQRKKLADDVAASQAKPQVTTKRECITAKDLERPFNVANSGDCTQSITKATKRQQDAKLECTGEVPASGSLHIESPNPERMSGTIDLRSGNKASPFTIKADINGRFLESDCGEYADEAEDALDDTDDEEQP